jgi:hypothetical protein
MNAFRPEAESEYSREHGADRGGEAGWQRRFTRYRATVLTLGVTGAAVLIAAEFAPLLHVRTIAARPRVVQTLQAGPHHGWALLPIAALALGLSGWVWRTGNRVGLAALALLGVAALVVTLAADLPDVHATGLVGTSATGLTNAQAHAALGLYLETLGGAVLLLAAAAGALLKPTRTASGHRGRRARKETRGLPTARDRGLR